MSKQPHTTGPHWFLPSEDCEESKRHGLNGEWPVIVHVITTHWDTKSDRLFVRLPEGGVLTSTLRGDWEPCPMPKRMRAKVASRKQAARDKANRSRKSD